MQDGVNHSVGKNMDYKTAKMEATSSNTFMLHDSQRMSPCVNCSMLHKWRKGQVNDVPRKMHFGSVRVTQGAHHLRDPGSLEHPLLGRGVTRGEVHFNYISVSHSLQRKPTQLMNPRFSVSVWSPSRSDCTLGQLLPANLHIWPINTRTQRGWKWRIHYFSGVSSPFVQYYVSSLQHHSYSLLKDQPGHVNMHKFKQF